MEWSIRMHEPLLSALTTTKSLPRLTSIVPSLSVSAAFQHTPGRGPKWKYIIYGALDNLNRLRLYLRQKELESCLQNEKLVATFLGLKSSSTRGEQRTEGAKHRHRVRPIGVGGPTCQTCKLNQWRKISNTNHSHSITASPPSEQCKGYGSYNESEVNVFCFGC